MHLRPDPLGIPRDPFRVFLIAWAAVSGCFLAAGVKVSDTLHRQLVTPVERLYGLLLGLSALMVLVGMFWPWDARDGLILKGSGYLGLAAATAVFGLATLAAWDVGGAMVGIATVAFAGICGEASWRCYRRLRSGARVARRGG